MFDDPAGPIEHFEWGMYVVNGVSHGKSGDTVIGAGKDIRIVGGNVTAWRERRGHRLSPDMITGVFGVGVETLIIGTGADGLIEYSEEVAASIRLRGISCIIGAPTPESCRIYNEMHRSGKRVALLAHGTC